MAWSPSGFGVFLVLPEGVSYATEGLRLLGVLLGTEEYVGVFLSSALEDDRFGLDQLWGPLGGHPDSHAGFCSTTFLPITVVPPDSDISRVFEGLR